MEREMTAPASKSKPHGIDVNPSLPNDAEPTGRSAPVYPTLPAIRYSEGMAIPEFTRLVVLVPDRDADETFFARKIWSLLPRRRVEVLFVTLVTDSNYGPTAQRRLVTLAAITQDIFYRISTRVIFGRSWVQGLAELSRPGDLVVCHSCQHARAMFREDADLADLVVSQINAPVYVLNGVFEDVVAPRPSRWMRQIVLWGILVGILAGFFVFEVDIDRLATGWMSSVLFILVFVVEVLLIWMWNFLRV
jgi:hypothetical protein